MILTVSEFREHVSSTLEDDALQRLLDAAEADIVRFAGPAGERTEYVDSDGCFVTTNYPIGTISSVVETRRWSTSSTTMATDDYLQRSEMVLERITGGTNSRSRWSGRVAVTYTPADDEALRQGVQIDLVNMALDFRPGVTSTTVGSWSEAYTQATGQRPTEVAAILARLKPGPNLAAVPS